MGSRTVPALLALVALGGCTKEEPRMPAACAAGGDAVLRALARAPESGALADGTRLSECVRRARTDAELQNLGLMLSQAADRLARDARAGDAAQAARLGFLTGAVRRGAARSNGLTLELSRRVDSAARRVEPAGPQLRRAIQRGLDAGRARG